MMNNEREQAIKEVVLPPMETAEGNKRFKENRYKIFAYPIILVFGYVLMNVCIYTFIPYINSTGLTIIGTNIADILVYYPTYLCIDVLFCMFCWWLCKKFAAFFIGFVKNQIVKYDAKNERKIARFGSKKRKTKKNKAAKVEMSE